MSAAREECVWISPLWRGWMGLADPVHAEFRAVLGSIETSDAVGPASPATEVVQVVGVDAAIRWGRDRAKVVLITLDVAHGLSGDAVFSAGVQPSGRYIGDEPFPRWPGSANIACPADGWHVPPDDDLLTTFQAALEALSDDPETIIPEPERGAEDDLRAQPEPPPSTHLLATFKWEDTDVNGEDFGPLIVFDPTSNSVVWESADWISVSDARKLAQAKGWQFNVDGSGT